MKTSLMLLIIISMSVSAGAWELGVQAGIRDWEESHDMDTRLTPMFAMTVGGRVQADSWLRLDALAGVYTREDRIPIYFMSPLDDVHGDYSTEDHLGFQVGALASLDPHDLRGEGRRIVRPVASGGVMWVTERRGEKPQIGGEYSLGLAIPGRPGADFLVLYNRISTALADKGDRTVAQYLTLGYRFSVAK